MIIVTISYAHAHCRVYRVREFREGDKPKQIWGVGEWYEPPFYLERITAADVASDALELFGDALGFNNVSQSMLDKREAEGIAFNYGDAVRLSGIEDHEIAADWVRDRL